MYVSYSIVNTSLDIVLMSEELLYIVPIKFLLGSPDFSAGTSFDTGNEHNC